MESALLNSVVVIATAAAVVKFALFEWEGIVHAWHRTVRQRRHGKRAGRPKGGARRRYDSTISMRKFSAMDGYDCDR